MRQKFESDLVGYSKVAKEEIHPSEDFDDVDLNQVIKYLEIESAKRQGTGVETQEEIYKIQIEKQKIMDWLKQKIKDLDNDDSFYEKTENGRELKYIKEKNRLSFADDNGKKWFCTLGQIMSDIDWDVEYNLDLESIPRPIAKKYYIRQAKKRLLELLDNQIMKSEIANNTTDWMKKRTYEKINLNRESGEVKEIGGFISEIIVKNFLERVSIDYHLPFEIKEADVFQDVEQKIDFIIHVKNGARGVDVEESENSDTVEVSKKEKDFGIQFTTNSSAESHKNDQIKRVKKSINNEKDYENENKNHVVDDIYLVVFPLNFSKIMKENWLQSGRLAGGPSRFMYSDTAETMFKGLLKNIFTDEEINEFWSKVKVEFEERPK